MTEYTLQLIMLAGAYVVVAIFAFALVTSTVISYRSTRKTSQKLALRQSAETRLTTLEHQQASLEDLVKSLNSRWAKRSRDERKTESGNNGAGPSEPEDRGTLEADWSSRNPMRH